MTQAPHHALITGGATGIGFAIAERLSQDGHTVTLAGRRKDALEDAVAKLKSAAFVVCDVTREASVQAAVELAVKQKGPLTALINNAGVAASAPFARVSLETWQKTLDVNLTGTFLCIRAALPFLQKAKHGRIVNIASTAGLKGYPYTAPYVAAKHGVVGLTKTLAQELAKDGIAVNAVCPGFTRTPMLERALATISEKTGRRREQALHELTRLNPQGRLIEPAEVAEVVAWLLSDAGRAVTGQTIAVAGGEAMS
jgi:NAD(P)-dependent dehydrogenase (short-subunit alcohol dehydrogenase family)